MRIRQTLLLGACISGLSIWPVVLQAQPSIRVTREAIEAASTSQLKVLSRTGIRTVPSHVESVQMQRGEYAAAHLDEALTSTSVGDSVRWQFPIRIIGTNSEGESLSLRPVVEVGGGGLRMISGSGEFGGQIHVGLEDERQPAQSRPLGRMIQMLVTGEAESIAPSAVAINHTNLPFLPVEIKARNPSDVITVRVRPEFDPEGINLPVPVVRPKLTVRASPRTIQGYGLETADLVIRVQGGPPNSSNVVTLVSEQSKPQPSIVAIDTETGTANAVVRSIGIGSATVVAEGDGLLSAAEQIEFAFPWAFMISATAGGIVGGLVRFILLKARQVQKIHYVALLWHLVLGVGAGFLFAVAYAVGVNLFENVHPDAKVGEALVFFIAGIGAVRSGRLVGKLPGGR